MEATRILVIRHGETAWNLDTRIQGQLDIPLNDTGRWQARRMALALASEPVHAVYSSDLARALETASILSQHHPGLLGRAPLVQQQLRERCFGSLEGQTWADIENHFPQEAARWRKREPEWAPQGGETLLQLRQRVAQILSRLAQRHLGEQIVLVAHGGVLDAIYRLATGVDISAPRNWPLTNTAINRLLWSPDRLTLLSWGDTRHLEEESLDERST
ncbi:MAG: histidine phosphatase family protein [Hylemonella sp.]